MRFSRSARERGSTAYSIHHESPPTVRAERRSPNRESNRRRIAAGTRLSIPASALVERSGQVCQSPQLRESRLRSTRGRMALDSAPDSEEHTSELQSRLHLVCRLLLEKKK